MNQTKTGFHLSIDVENLSRSTETLEFERSLDPLLFKLNESNIKATFFVLGQLVTRWKTRIAEIQSEGHEVALHGYSHTPIETLGEKKFAEETKIGCDILSEALGRQAYGYRAPYFSLTKNVHGHLRSSSRLTSLIRRVCSRRGIHRQATPTLPKIHSSGPVVSLNFQFSHMALEDSEFRFLAAHIFA